MSSNDILSSGLSSITITAIQLPFLGEKAAYVLWCMTTSNLYWEMGTSEYRPSYTQVDFDSQRGCQRALMESVNFMSNTVHVCLCESH